MGQTYFSRLWLRRFSPAGGDFLLGYAWFRSEPMDSPAIKLAGYSMLVLMVPTLLTLWRMPDVRSRDSAGGLLGHLVSEGCRRLSYGGSKSRRSGDLFCRAFSTTKFSFIETHEWLRGP